jgi:hypothetical protein
MSKYKTNNQEIDIKLITKNPWNPNQMDKKTLKAEKESIEKYGIVAPIIVRPLKNKYQIIDGEHRYIVCSELGYKLIPSVIIEGLKDKDAKKLTIILNETKGSNDKIELGKLLGELEKDFGDNLKIGLPFNDDDLNDLIEFGNVDWDKYETGNKGDIAQDEVYKLHLIFKGDDITLVKDRLSLNPEDTILDLLKKESKK